MANGDPISVAYYERHIWIGDFPLAYLVGSVVYLDPPFATMWSAQIPLIPGVHTFCFCRLKTAAHRIEHEALLSFHLLGHFVIPISRFVILSASLLNSPQKKSGAEECDHRPSQKNHQIVNIKRQTRAIHVHQPESAAKMCKWKQLGNVANRLG